MSQKVKKALQYENISISFYVKMKVLVDFHTCIYVTLTP